MHASTPLLLTLLSLPLLSLADNPILPVATFPACALLCGPLFDVQGACIPPVTAAVSPSCFCGDPRLTPMAQAGTAGVEAVCGPKSCQDTPSLEFIQSWYEGYCNLKDTNATPTGTSAAASSTASSDSSNTGKSKNVNNGWFSTHWRWVVMLVIMVVGLTALGVGSSLLRKRYLRNKDKAFEMRPPVAWGQHQTHDTAGGDRTNAWVANASQVHNEGKGKEADRSGARESKGWLTKKRF